MATISLLITASRDESSLRALLELVRPVVDEIVFGVDARTADRIFGSCGDLVDQAYTYEFKTTVEQYAAWLHHRCTGDWILRISDDEVPSPALLEALPEIAADRRRSLVLVPIRHLFPTRDRFITSHPWHPEYQARLTRNIPGIWTFPGTSHTNIEVLGERRRLPEVPLYPLHFAVPDTEAPAAGAPASAARRASPRHASASARRQES